MCGNTHTQKESFGEFLKLFCEQQTNFIGMKTVVMVEIPSLVMFFGFFVTLVYFLYITWEEIEYIHM